MKQYPVRTVTLKNNETIAYRQSGQQGKTVVLIHGNMSSSVHWQLLIEALENDYQVYAMDLRGFGDSSYNTPLNSLHDFAQDVEYFAEALGLENFSLVGWSTGGGIILEAAADFGKRVEQIILLDSVGLTGFPMFAKDAKGRPIPTQRLTTKEEIAKDPIQVKPILDAYADNNRDLLKYIWNASIYHLNQPSEEDYEIYLDAIFKQRNLVDVDYSLVMFNMTHEFNGVKEGSGRLDLIKSPVTIVHGVKDLVVPYQEALEMKNYFQDRAKLVPFPECGHSIITDDLEGLVRELRNVLD